MSNPKILIPQDALRLLDALTVKYGPADLIARFMLQADKFARDRGVYLKLRTNWDALVDINRAEIAKGNWYPLAAPFDPERTDLAPDNSFWIQGENSAGETVLCCGVRVYDWRHTTLADEVRLMFYGGRDYGQECEVTTPKAAEISGFVSYGGSLWVRPDYRRLSLSTLAPRVVFAHALATWPVSWTIGMVKEDQVAKGISAGYGMHDVSWSVKFPNSPLGDLDLALLRASREETYTDLSEFIAKSLAPMARASAVA
jgi:hypothetical protein